MKFNANIDYESEPEAIIKFIDAEANIYPELSKAMKNKINRDYNLTTTISVSQRTLKKVFPTQFKEYAQALKVKERIPPHYLSFLYKK